MLNYFDILVLVVTLGLFVSGFFEGLIRGVIKLTGFIAVIVFMSIFSDTIIDIVIVSVNLPPKIAIPLVFLLIFSLSSIAVYFIAEILHKIIKLTPIRIIDSGLGSIFGLLKAFCITGILAMLLSFSTPGTFLNDQYNSSRTAGPLNELFGRAVPFMKSAVTPIYRKYVPPELEKDINEDEKEENNNEQPQII